MRCLGCGGEMLLTQVVLDDTRKGLGFERHTYNCSACPQIARRVVFWRAKMPVTELPVVATQPEAPVIELPAPSPWAKAVEKLHSRQIALKERAAEAAPARASALAVAKVSSIQTAVQEQTAVEAAGTLAWAKAVEKLRSWQTALNERAAKPGPARASAWTERVEKLRSRQRALNEQAAEAARASAWTKAKAVEKLHSRQAIFNERTAAVRTSGVVIDFNRMWDDPRGETPASKPLARHQQPLVKPTRRSSERLWGR